MCGRFHLATISEDLATLFDLDRMPDLTPRYNIAPTQVAGVVRVARGKREWAEMTWGLVASWAKDASSGSRMINARSESVSTSPAYRAAFRRRRCLVPADGFYEWKKLDGKTKQPMEIRLRTGEPFAMAGLWEWWESPDGALETFTILTCPSSDVLRPIHDRMPVILEREQWGTWLDPSLGEDARDREALQAMLDPYPGERMEAYPISTRVNSPKNDDPSLLRRVDAPAPGLFG